jgi:transcriptional regulator with XRE-family HTH domain
MSTSPSSFLSNPVGEEKISEGTLGYLGARTQARAHTLVVKEFKKSGLTQAQFARRLGKGQDVISRLLNRPGNWGINTLCELLFAATGAVLTFSVTYPLKDQDDTPALHFRVAESRPDIKFSASTATGATAQLSQKTLVPAES